MIRAEPEELREEVVPVLEASLPEHEARRLLSVRLRRLDPLAEAEPSLGALLRLESGTVVVAVYGRETATLSLRLPETSIQPDVLRSLLEEIPIPEQSITWKHPAVEAHARASVEASLPSA